MAVLSVAVAQLSGTSILVTPPKNSKASMCPSSHDLSDMSGKASANTLAEHGGHMTRTWAAEVRPVSRSVMRPAMPAQSM